MNRWEFWCSYEERFTPKDARFAFDPRVKRWFTTSSRVAVRLFKYATPVARFHIKRVQKEFERQREYRKAALPVREPSQRRIRTKSAYRYNI